MTIQLPPPPETPPWPQEGADYRDVLFAYLGQVQRWLDDAHRICFFQPEAEMQYDRANGELNSDTVVEILGSVQGGYRRDVTTLRFHNADTADVTLTVSLVAASKTSTQLFKSTISTLGNVSVIAIGETLTLQPGDHIQAVLAGAVSANQPTYYVRYRDVAPAPSS